MSFTTKEPGKQSSSSHRNLHGNWQNRTVDDQNNNPPNPPDQKENKVVFLKSVRNEQKDKKQPTKQSKPKSAAEKSIDERFYKLVEILEEHQDRIRRLENNLLSLARIFKAMRDDLYEASEKAKKSQTPPPSPPTAEE